MKNIKEKLNHEINITLMFMHNLKKTLADFTCEELHQAAVRFCNMIYPHEKTSKDEGGFIGWGMFLMDLKKN